MRRKLIPVKLTKAQWDLVAEAVREWSALCYSESDYPDRTFNKGMRQRADRLEHYATSIGLQVAKATGETE